MSDTTPTQSTTNRFAVSLLSKSNRSGAKNEEMMVDKKSAEISIKTPEGYIISHDSLSRQRNHIERIVSYCQSISFNGSLNELIIEDTDYPWTPDLDVNILDGVDPLNIGNKDFLISLDVDPIELSEDFSRLAKDVLVTITLQVSNQPVELNYYVSELNKRVISPTNIEGYDSNFPDVYINSIKFSKTNLYSESDTVKIGIILYSFMIVTK